MNSPQQSTQLLSEMIGLIYEAAADLSLWPKLLESMTEYLEPALLHAGQGGVPVQPDSSDSNVLKTRLSQAERSLVDFLAPHFERAHAIHLQLAEAIEERNLLEVMMNRLPLGVAIIDAQCNAISLNRTLTSMLQGSPQLKLVSGRLVSQPINALQQAVSAIVSGTKSEEVMRIGEEGVSFSLWVTRGNVPLNANPNLIRLMVLVASRTTHALSEQGLIVLYGLTPAEARVTQQLALGCTLEETSDKLNIARNTAKAQLSGVFKKVGVKRQAELMQAIYASPLWLQTEDNPLSIKSAELHLPARVQEDSYIRLSDGRALYYSDNGDAKAHPVILMHGIAGSRILRHPDDDILMQEGIRLIIPERPGSGDSDSKADRRVTDWPQDIAELAQHLKLDRFSILGYSAGTAYALAVAAAMPERIQSVHIVAAVPPIDSMEDFSAYSPVFRMTLLIGKYTPSLLPAMIRMMVKDIRKNVYLHLEKNLHDASAQDREILKNPKLRSYIATGLRASVRHGDQEISREIMLSAQSWGIDLTKINSKVDIWHGEHDPMVALAGAKKLVELLPNAKLTQVPDAGHYLLYSHWQDLLRSVKAGAALS